MVLIPLRTRTPSQFGLVSSMFFLNSSGHLTRVTFTQSTYLISFDRLTQILPKQLTRTPPKRPTRALPNRINAYPALYFRIRLNFLTRFLSRSDFYFPALHGLTRPNYLKQSLPVQTSAYSIIPGHLTRPGNTSLHLTAYPSLPNQLTRPGTLQLASPEDFLIGLPP
jgi:hypothetical protein